MPQTLDKYRTPELGEKIPMGTVIAYGYYLEEGERPIFSVMLFLDRSLVDLMDANYVCAFASMDDEGELVIDFESPIYHRNIVMAAECYADDFGMDV